MSSPSASLMSSYTLSSNLSTVSFFSFQHDTYNYANLKLLLTHYLSLKNLIVLTYELYSSHVMMGNTWMYSISFKLNILVLVASNILRYSLRERTYRWFLFFSLMMAVLLSTAGILYLMLFSNYLIFFSQACSKAVKWKLFYLSCFSIWYWRSRDYFREMIQFLLLTW